MARQVYSRYLDELDDADVRGLAIRWKGINLDYSRRCAEASAMQARMKQGIMFAPGMEISYVIKDAYKWKVDPRAKGIEFRFSILSMAAREGLVRGEVMCFHGCRILRALPVIFSTS